MHETTATYDSVPSADTTPIAYETRGSGPAVVLVGGAFNERTTMIGLAEALAPRCTAVVYDRRGRGDSGDTLPYAPEREFDDLAAVMEATRARAAFGHSSGAALCLEAAAAGVPIERMAVYEAPYVVESADRARPPLDLAARLDALLGAGDLDGAAALFLVEAAGMPREMLAGLRQAPPWPGMTALAHTLPRDVAMFPPGQDAPVDRLGRIAAPVLALAGGDSPEWLRQAMVAVATAIPRARQVTIEHQDHGILYQPQALLPELEPFLLGRPAAGAPGDP